MPLFSKKKTPQTPEEIRRQIYKEEWNKIASGKKIAKLHEDGSIILTPNQIRSELCVRDAQRRRAEGKPPPLHIYDYPKQLEVKQERDKKFNEQAKAMLRELSTFTAEYLGPELFRLPEYIREAIIDRDRNGGKEPEPKPEGPVETHDKTPATSQSRSQEAARLEGCSCAHEKQPTRCCNCKEVKPRCRDVKTTVVLTCPVSHYCICQHPYFRNSTAQSSVIRHKPLPSLPTEASSAPPGSTDQSSQTQEVEVVDEFTRTDETLSDKVSICSTLVSPEPRAVTYQDRATQTTEIHDDSTDPDVTGSDEVSEPFSQLALVPHQATYQEQGTQTEEVPDDLGEEASDEKVNDSSEAQTPTDTNPLPIWRPTIASKARERKKHQ
ncbi:hypothetical protein N7492_009870 [Penicillium capsulatum]|uniref:Uncharacterized protein n=1 Tax=Penicillium capsulatum TaxID=69766 RepID=A0A9W9HMN1_9EURO|nr:hypothetical protein N7492_009870 [Penicillium capsulatum]KAJ6112381.1 hypothetical protein N7512_007705 [Penicillium capsulatum]